MNADGTGAVKLGVGRTPAWKPDGSQIAFYSHRDGADGLYLMNPDGSGVSKLISGVGGLDPAWSPDGANMAFDCQIDSGTAGICAINADGTGLVRLASDPGAHAPAWKPDGSKILYSGGGGLALMNPDGTGVATLISASFNDDALEHPRWSSSGLQITFTEYLSSLSCDVWSCGLISWHQVDVANAGGTGKRIFATGRDATWRP